MQIRFGPRWKQPLTQAKGAAKPDFVSTLNLEKL
jgi:hypothetical protein